MHIKISPFLISKLLPKSHFIISNLLDKGNVFFALSKSLTNARTIYVLSGWFNSSLTTRLPTLPKNLFEEFLWLIINIYS